MDPGSAGSGVSEPKGYRPGTLEVILAINLLVVFCPPVNRAAGNLLIFAVDVFLLILTAVLLPAAVPAVVLARRVPALSS